VSVPSSTKNAIEELPPEVISHRKSIERPLSDTLISVILPSPASPRIIFVGERKSILIRINPELIKLKLPKNTFTLLNEKGRFRVHYYQPWSHINKY
jgi:hypothetical protein